MDNTGQHHHAGRHASRGKWVLLGFLVVAAFFLWSEHRAHLLGILPYLLVLACPLMHLFHHGHGHHHEHGSSSPKTTAIQEQERPGEKS